MLRELGLQEVLTNKYTTQPGQSTSKHGTTIIDGMWTTVDLEFIQGGHEDVLSPSGDHCWIWADFSIDSILGTKLDPFTKPITKNSVANFQGLKRSTKNY